MKDMDDFKWIEDVVPQPMGLDEVLTLRSGEYKMWLGNISKEKQLTIINYLLEMFQGNGYDYTNSFNSIIDGVESDKYMVNSLYMAITNKRVRLTKMSHGNDFLSDDMKYCRCREYFFECEDTFYETDLSHLLEGFI
jgi:hypothetical protein